MVSHAQIALDSQHVQKQIGISLCKFSFAFGSDSRWSSRLYVSSVLRGIAAHTSILGLIRQEAAM